MVRVFVNGFGTIGKRVAFAVKKQDDMELVGIAKRRPDFKAYIANRVGIPLYAIDDNSIEKFEEHGIRVEGTLSDALEKVDIVVDTAPKGVGKENKAVYEKYGLKAIFQGGEKPNVADVSFTAQANYRDALGKRYIRVVSCNTTAMARIISAIRNCGKIKKIRGVLVRRAADPWESKKGPINAIVPTLKIPSHHAEDVKTVLGELDIMTTAVVVPTTIMHMHILNVEFENKVGVEDVINRLDEAPRILIISSNRLSIDSTATMIELARDLGRDRNDIYEVMVVEESVRAYNNELWMMYAVHQEAIVVPENIDAIRAAFRIYEEPMDSIKKTDRILGILSKL